MWFVVGLQSAGAQWLLCVGARRLHVWFLDSHTLALVAEGANKIRSGTCWKENVVSLDLCILADVQVECRRPNEVVSEESLVRGRLGCYSLRSCRVDSIPSGFATSPSRGVDVLGVTCYRVWLYESVLVSDCHTRL